MKKVIVAMTLILGLGMVSCNYDIDTSEMEFYEFVPKSNDKQVKTKRRFTPEEHRAYTDSLKAARDSVKFKESIKLLKYYTGKPNSAGGVNAYIKWENISSKTIKYALFKITAFNAVNDIVSGDYSSASVWVKVTGPVRPGSKYGYGTYWENIWYNSAIDYMKITGIKIEYMDGTSIITENLGTIKSLGYCREDNEFE